MADDFALPPELEEESQALINRVDSTVLKKTKLNSTTENAPDFADGNTPDSAINTSPVSILDRAKLSFGGRDTQAQIDFLNERFDAVRVNSNDDLVVAKEGKWHRVDADNFGDTNAWSLTDHLKETLGDVADVSKEGTIVGASIGAAALTGGSSLLVQGAALGAGAAVGDVATTSMGKLVGTYDGTPGDQLQEAGGEFLINAAGGIVMGKAAQGLKAASKTQVGRKLIEKSGEAFANAVEWAGKKIVNPVPKRMWTTLAGAFSGVKPENLNRMMDRSSVIKPLYKRTLKSYAKNPEGTIQGLVAQNVDDFGKVVNLSRRSLSAWYDKQMGILKGTVPQGLRGNVASHANNLVSQLQAQGLVQTTTRGGVRRMSIPSQDEIIAKFGAQLSGDAPTDSLLRLLAKNKTVHKEFSNLVRELRVLGASGERTGAGAIDDFLRAQKQWSQFSRNFKTKLYEKEPAIAKEAVSLVDDIWDNNIQNNVFNDFARSGSDDLIKQLTNINREYAGFKSGMKPLLDLQAKLASKRAGSKDVETLMNQYLQSAEKQVSIKASVDGMKSFGLGEAQFRSGQLALESDVLGKQVTGAMRALGTSNRIVNKSLERIADRNAVAQGLPAIRGNFIQFGSVQIAGGAAGAAVGALAGEGGAGKAVGGAGLGFLGALALTSPRRAANIALKRGVRMDMVAGAMLKLKDFVGKLPEATRIELFNNPEAMNKLAQTLFVGANQAAQTQQQLRQAFDQRQAQ
jgi:carbonic anhydrase/acetyltransferase-like protein (isoleucine patch superfamily)